MYICTKLIYISCVIWRRLWNDAVNDEIDTAFAEYKNSSTGIYDIL